MNIHHLEVCLLYSLLQGVNDEYLESLLVKMFKTPPHQAQKIPSTEDSHHTSQQVQNKSIITENSSVNL